MIVRDKPPVFDGVMVLEGKFQFLQHVGQEPAVEVKMAYVNSSTSTTYGACDFSSPSPKTLEKFRQFVDSIEEDFGQVVFEGGIITPFGPTSPTSRAESDERLPPGLGE